MAERLDRSRAGCVQGGQPAAEDNNGRAGLAMAAEPADLGAQPVVPRAGPAPWRADAQDDHRRPGAQAAHRPVAVHDRRRRHRGGRDEGGTGDDLTPSARTLSVLPDPGGRTEMTAGLNTDRKNGPGLLSPTAGCGMLVQPQKESGDRM